MFRSRLSWRAMSSSVSADGTLGLSFPEARIRLQPRLRWPPWSGVHRWDDAAGPYAVSRSWMTARSRDAMVRRSRHCCRPRPCLQASIGAQTWFCDPQSPWQKGTVENTNRRARKWLSREVDPLSLSNCDLTDICNHLNATPRKCLGYKTPAEVFRQKRSRRSGATVSLSKRAGRGSA